MHRFWLPASLLFLSATAYSGELTSDQLSAVYSKFAAKPETNEEVIARLKAENSQLWKDIKLILGQKSEGWNEQTNLMGLRIYDNSEQIKAITKNPLPTSRLVPMDWRSTAPLTAGRVGDGYFVCDSIIDKEMCLVQFCKEFAIEYLTPEGEIGTKTEIEIKSRFFLEGIPTNEIKIRERLTGPENLVVTGQRLVDGKVLPVMRPIPSPSGS